MAKKNKKKMDGESTVGTQDIVIACPTMIWKVLDSSHGRYALGFPRFDPITNKRGRWIATNGKVAVVVHVDGNFDKTDDSYAVPPEVMPKKKTLRDVRLLDGSWSATGPSGSDSVVVANPTDDEAGRFPDVYPSVFPESFDTFTDKGGATQSRTHVSLDARLLLSVAEAINCKLEGSKTVTLAIGGPGDSVAVVGDTGIGVIMPCLGEDNKAQASAYKRNAVESARHQSPEAVPVVFAPKEEYEEFLRWKSDEEKTKKTKVTKEPVLAAVPTDAEGEDYMDYE
jgi:hypothetical protein